MIEITFGEGISVKHAESAASRLADGNPSEPVTLDLRACRHVDAGVGWRLGNALRPYANHNSLLVYVPRINSEKDLNGEWSRLLTRSGLGHAISLRSDRIISGDTDVTELFVRYYSQLGQLATPNFCSIPWLTRPGVVEIEDFDKFTNQFGSLAAHVGIDTNLGDQRRKLDALTKLCFEAAQNVHDHAERSPLQSGTNVFSRLSVSYYKVLSRVDWPGDFHGYVNRTEAHLGGSSENPGFVEVVVADDGVGLASRHALNGHIYEGSSGIERAAFVEALQTGNSIKLIAGDTTVRGDPGYGFTYITAGLRALRAYAVLRSGRLMAIFDGTSEPEAFRLLEEDFGYLPGTALDVIFPRPTAQLRLPGM